MYLFALGLFKKVLIADTFGKAVALGFGDIGAVSSMEAWIVSLSYTFQIYFDFSGYCDMAIGIGHLFNVELPANFNSPYKSSSITEFWGRWHMSLTRFLRTYIYIPLGGNRKGMARTCLNVMIVYLVSGIWHGANWTFVLWGLLHGALCCLNRFFAKSWDKLGVVMRWCMTFIAVNILWVLFRAEDIASAGLFVQKMFSLSGSAVREELYQCFELMELAVLGNLPVINMLYSHITGFYMWIFILGAFWVVLRFRNSKEIEFKPTFARSLAVIVLMVWSVLSLGEVSSFLYFNF